MKFFTIHIAILILLVGYSFSNEEQNPCKPYDFLHEIAQIPKFDSARHSAIAKYCLNYGGYWELLPYEQISPFEIRIQKECRIYSLGGTTNLEPSGMFSGMMFGGSGSCIAYTNIDPNKKRECKADTIEFCNDCIGEFIFNSCYLHKETDNISFLFDKYLPIKWDLRISCDGEKSQIPTPENYYIYISGFCNKEQLKKIETLNKARKKE